MRAPLRDCLPSDPVSLDRGLISAVIVQVGDAELLRACLATLGDAVDSGRLEIVVVDNASGASNLEEVVAPYPKTRIVLLERRCGYSAATNAGIRASRGEYLLWCNNDLLFRPGSVDLLAGFLHGHPEYGAVGPKLLNSDGSYQPSFSLLDIGLWTLLPAVLGIERMLPRWDIATHTVGRSGSPRDVAVVPGACALIRRAALDGVGGILDERFFLYTEEYDLSRSLRRAGWHLRYLPDSEVVHLGGQTTVATDRRWVMEAQAWRSRLAYVRKHQGPFAESALAGCLLAGFGARWIRAAVLAWWHARRRQEALAGRQRGRVGFYSYLFRVIARSDRNDSTRLPELG